ncbi:MAG: PIN domain-containing protein [Nitrococcus sp.]|nr:PIN domain-containing protein [Nitrococcus sp.]
MGEVRRETFFDSNIPLYLLSDDAAKAQRAESLLIEGGVISVQVLNELARVMAGKYGMPWNEVRQTLQTLRRTCEVLPLTLETHELGLWLAERQGFAFFDALIVASALLAGCTVLYSEDFQHGIKVENRLTIRNPFIAG